MIILSLNIEHLQRGTFEPKNSHTAVLSDYQMIKLNHTLDIDGNSDNDTLTDKTELGTIKWMDITSFVEKTYNDMKNKGEQVKSTLEAQIEDIVNKQGGNYLEKRWGHVKVEGEGENMRVYYLTYDYTSNPVLDDTDFDGIKDDQDSKKLNGTFTGTSADIGKVEYNNDFRWFYTKNTKYNDELAVMSLIASNLANGKSINTDQVSGNITQYLSNLGFTDVRGVGENGSVYMGKKTITYYGVTKNIYAVILGGGETKSNYRAIFNYVNEEDTQTISLMFKENKKMTIQDIASDIANDAYFSTMDNTFWVTGYGVAGSLASEVAAKFTDEGGEVFCYTFGATNTGVGVKGSYPNIKNVINEDDYVPKIVNPDVYQRPGQTYSSSIKEDLMREYRDIVGDTNYKGDFYLSNYLGKVFKESLTGMSLERLNQLLYEWSRHLEYYGAIPKDLQENAETGDVAIAIDAMKEANKDARSIKAYYVLAKSLNGFDLTDGNGAKIAKYGQVRLLSTDSGETYTDDEKELKDPRNGYPYNCNKDYYISEDNYNNSKEDTVMIKPFMYSNYTLDGKKVEYKDINYVKFWHSGNKNIPTNQKGIEQLYKYHAGDMSQSTHCTHGSYIGKKYINNYSGEVKVDERLSLGHNKGNLVTINNRIIAAFPSALFYESFNYNSEFEKSREILNKWESYNIDTIDETGKNGGDFRGASIVAKEKDMYKLVDVVIEDENGQQFIVPFIVIDAKAIHYLPEYDKANKKGMLATLTDNRYGQVMEIINDENRKVYKYHKYYSNSINREVWFDDAETEIANKDIENGNTTFVNMNKSIIYYDRDEEREATYISAIEPYISEGIDKENIDMIMTNLICGKGISIEKPSCKIVSMRLYDERCAEDDGTPIEGTWEKRQEEIEKNTNNAIKEKGSIEKYLKEYHKDIVKYK